MLNAHRKNVDRVLEMYWKIFIKHLNFLKGVYRKIVDLYSKNVNLAFEKMLNMFRKMYLSHRKNV